jgi:hypothetical protein
MPTSLPATLPFSIRVRGHGVRLVVVFVAVVIVALVRPPGALGTPMAPIPAGVWPLQPAPVVVRGFDPPGAPWDSGHRGADLAGATGQVVHAALAGRVTFARRLAGRGVIVVDHGATRTTYEPVTASVAVGTAVTRGQRLGTLELTGSHCLPRACLHWGWRRGATYLDPLLLVGGGPVVLLPLGLGPGPAPVLAVPQMPEIGVPDVEPGRPTWRRPLAMRQDAGPATITWSTSPRRAGPTSGSGPRVGLPVGLAEAVGADVGVELRGRQ